MTVDLEYFTEIGETGLIFGSLFGVENDILRIRLDVVKSRNVLFLKVHMDNGHADIFLDRYAYTPSII